MKTIVELSSKYDTDKKMNDGIKCRNGVFGHNYAIHYDNYFIKNKNIKNILEIGVSFGSSIKMWDEYFDSKVNIIGIDINEKRFNKSELEKENIKIYLGDQKDINFLQNFKDIEFDIIIDDGSHRMMDQQISFKELFKFVKNGGLYIIEDLHTSNNQIFYDSIEETTTIDLILSLKRNEIINSNYINKKEYSYLLNNIDNIEIFENNTITFITKKL